MRGAVRRGTLLAAVLLALSTAAIGSREVPYLSGRITDEIGLLSPLAKSSLEDLLRTYEDSTTNQVAVLIIASLDGESLEEYSLRVAETWKLGRKGSDNGVLLLIAKDDRKLRIEVGYGLEASLTDAVCSWIITNEITPRFKDGDFDAGVEAGVRAIISAAEGSYTMEESTAGSDMDVTDALLFSLIWFSVVLIFTLVAIISEGCSGWFLYLFLIPFWGAGAFVLSEAVGVTALALPVIYLITIPVLRIVLAKTAFGARLKKKLKISQTGNRISIGGLTFTSSTGSSSGWSSGGGGGFSGGGGSFGGGGSSGSW